MAAMFANVGLNASRRRSLCFVHVPEKGAIKADAIALGTENGNDGVAMIKESKHHHCGGTSFRASQLTSSCAPAYTAIAFATYRILVALESRLMKATKSSDQVV